MISSNTVHRQLRRYSTRFVSVPGNGARSYLNKLLLKNIHLDAQEQSTYLISGRVHFQVDFLERLGDIAIGRHLCRSCDCLRHTSLQFFKFLFKMMYT